MERVKRYMDTIRDFVRSGLLSSRISGRKNRFSFSSDEGPSKLCILRSRGKTWLIVAYIRLDSGLEVPSAYSVARSCLLARQTF